MIADAPTLTWNELTAPARDALNGKLSGLYGGQVDADIFDALPVDKQQSLLIFVRRLGDLKLWREISRVTNVYGEGGVGIEFISTAGLPRCLRRSRRFSSRFAAHRDTAEGFYELRRSVAALHFLRARRRGLEWSVHFDLYAPLSSPASALRHLWYEKLRGQTPSWKEIASVLDDASRKINIQLTE